MKKILFTIYTYSMGGGAEKILSIVANGLAERTDYEISIQEYADYGVKTECTSNKVKILKPIVNMKQTSRVERIVKILAAHFCPMLLRKWYATERYDVEISFNYQIPSFLTRKSAYNIQWIHSDVYDLQGHPFKRFLQSRSYKKADKIVVISENTARSVTELFPQYRHKLCTVYNGIDTAGICAGAEKPTDVQLAERTMVFLGRWDHTKDPLRLVQYTHRLIQEGVDVSLCLLGHGKLEAELAAYIENAGLGDRIRLLGYVHEPYAIIKQSAAVCMLSTSEGFPTVFAEGMALGVPFISTPVGGVEELADNGACGVVVNSYEEFKQAVLDVVIDRENAERMQRNCREHIKKFSCERQLDDIIALIEQS